MVDDEHLLQAKTDELIQLFDYELGIDRDLVSMASEMHINRHKQIIDDYIQRGSSDFQLIIEATDRAVKNEKQYFLLKAEHHLGAICDEFGHRIKQFAAMPDKTFLRDNFRDRLNENKEKFLVQVDLQERSFLDVANHYRRDEIEEVTKKFSERRMRIKFAFARERARDNTPCIDACQHNNHSIGKSLSVDEYEDKVKQAAESFNRIREDTMSVLQRVAEYMENFAKKSIDECLSNGCGVFDIFMKMPNIVERAVISEVLQAIEEVEESLKFRVLHWHSICESKVVPKELFKDRTYPEWRNHSRWSSEKAISIYESLRIYRVEERKQAQSNFKTFKNIVEAEEIIKNLQLDEFEDLSKYKESWEEIGRGGQATVYAFDMPMKGSTRRVAAKKYTKGSAAEISLCRIKHSNVLSYLTAGKIDEEIFLISDYLPSTLAKEIAICPDGMRKNDFMRYITEMATGMNFMRYTKLHHGDLKPDNILISGDGTLKLCDFGISSDENNKVKLHRRDSGWSELIRLANRVVECDLINAQGTKEYMAPELHRGASISAKFLEMSDVWSFGIVVWQMMARRRPHEEIDQRMLAMLIDKVALHPPLPEFSNVESLVNLLRKCWNKNNPSRPTFKRILEDLDDVHEELENISEEEWNEECAMWNVIR